MKFTSFSLTTFNFERLLATWRNQPALDIRTLSFLLVSAAEKLPENSAAPAILTMPYATYLWLHERPASFIEAFTGALLALANAQIARAATCGTLTTLTLQDGPRWSARLLQQEPTEEKTTPVFAAETAAPRRHFVITDIGQTADGARYEPWPHDASPACPCPEDANAPHEEALTRLRALRPAENGSTAWPDNQLRIVAGYSVLLVCEAKRPMPLTGATSPRKPSHKPHLPGGTRRPRLHVF